MNKVRKAVIPVAGFGTRFLPFTKVVPKAMLPVVNRPAIEIIIDEAMDSGIEEIALIVGQNKEILEKHFSENLALNTVLSLNGKTEYYKCVNKYQSCKIILIEQKEQKGTANAVAVAGDFIGDEPFAVMFGDDLMYGEKPVIGQLIDVFNSRGKTVIGCKRVDLSLVSKYACVEYDENEGNVYKITKITEKPAPEEIKSNLSPLGRYVCPPEILEVIANLKTGRNGEYQFTDALDIISRTQGGYALDFDGTRYDMGDRLGFLKANVEFALRNDELKEEFAEYLKKI